MVYKSGRCEIFCFFVTILFISSVRSSISHPDLLVIKRQHHPTFSDIACRLSYNIIRLSLSEQLQLYQKQSLDSSAGYMYIYLMGTTGHHSLCHKSDFNPGQMVNVILLLNLSYVTLKAHIDWSQNFS